MELTEYHFYNKIEVDNEIALLIQSRNFWKKRAEELESKAKVKHKP